MANYQQNYQREQTGMVNYYQMGTCVIIPLALVLAASEWSWSSWARSCSVLMLELKHMGLNNNGGLQVQGTAMPMPAAEFNIIVFPSSYSLFFVSIKENKWGHEAQRFTLLLSRIWPDQWIYLATNSIKNIFTLLYILKISNFFSDSFTFLRNNKFYIN